MAILSWVCVCAVAGKACLWHGIQNLDQLVNELVPHKQTQKSKQTSTRHQKTEQRP
ncbi:hypothetical protein BaRGS_00033469, partial [Batillaria attramentaria]